jgi:hypothetical protein
MDYEQCTLDFFTFYSTFNFREIISVYSGRAYNLQSYLHMYPEYRPTAISIPGPINLEKNCQQISESVKREFVELCEASSEYLYYSTST